jgi:uncharacterized DUF497 family protein
MYMTIIYFRMADIRALLAQASGFEWDDGSAAVNGPGSGVTRAECEQLFLNEPLVVADDAIVDAAGGEEEGGVVPKGAARSSHEVRGHALGETDEGRLLFAAFTVRNGLVRVTAARPMTGIEREVYNDVRDEEESP